MQGLAASLRDAYVALCDAQLLALPDVADEAAGHVVWHTKLPTAMDLRDLVDYGEVGRVDEKLSPGRPSEVVHATGGAGVTIWGGASPQALPSPRPWTSPEPATWFPWCVGRGVSLMHTGSLPGGVDPKPWANASSEARSVAEYLMLRLLVVAAAKTSEDLG